MCFKCMGRTSRYLRQPNPCALFYHKTHIHPYFCLFTLYFVQVLWIILVAAAIFAIISAHDNRQTKTRRIFLQSISSPALVDGCMVCPWADVFYNVGILLTADVERGVVGFTHGEEVGCGVARHELEDVCDEGGGAQTKCMDAFGRRRI